MKADIHTIEAITAGSIELADHIFGLEPRADLIHRVIQWQLNKRQQGTHQAKSRGEISRTTKKLGPQKGSGGARHGARHAPQFRGGGRAVGPEVRSHAIDLPKKVRALALKHALSAKAAAGELIVVQSVATKEPKTAALVKQFDALAWSSALIIDGAEVDKNFAHAARNIPQIDVLPVQGINVADILRRTKLVLTKAALEALEARFA